MYRFVVSGLSRIIPLLFLLFCVPPARAQSTVAISGVVSDVSGAVVSGATLDAIVAGRRASTATTDGEGEYHLDVPAHVPVEIQVRRQGFAEQVISLPGSGSPSRRNILLAVGGVSDALIVTAGRTTESRLAVTESVTSFTRQDLERLGSSSLADVVRFTPGVNLEATGREGAVTSMFSRGGESDYNLVLIDGVRANVSGGIFDFSRISAADIERVEVVRGAQSALWGSDAMGSVVQVFTRRAGASDAPQLTGSIEGGSFGVLRGDMRVQGGAANAVDYHVGASHRSSNGAFADLLEERDEFEQRSVDAGAGIVLGSRASVRGAVRYTRASGRSVGQIVYGARDTGTAYDTRDLSSHVSLTHVTGSRLTGTATFNDFRYESRSADTVSDPAFSTYAILAGTPNALFPNGTRLVRLIDASEFASLSAAGAMPAPGQFLASRQTSDFPFDSANDFKRPAFRYQADYALGIGALSGGYEWERESNPLTDAFPLTNNAAFVQQHIELGDRWFATFGGRVDSKEGYDTFFSPKLSAGGYLIPHRAGGVSSLKVFGNLGKGIKSPTSGERFGGSFADPSPDLKVERARTGDVGIETTFADQRFLARVVYFNNDYVDQIAFRSGVPGDGIPEFINIDGSKADGWELEWALQRGFGGFTAAATYSYVDNRVVTNLSTSQQFQPGQPLLRRPRHSGTARASFARGPIAIYSDIRIVGDRHDHSFLSLRTVPNAQMPAALTTDITVNPGYAVIGAGVDVEVGDRATLFARVSNLGDEQYESVLGYPGLPRAVVAGMRFRFGLR